jgi:hypothetical protein
MIPQNVLQHGSYNFKQLRAKQGARDCGVACPMGSSSMWHETSSLKVKSAALRFNPRFSLLDQYAGMHQYR